MGDKRVNDRCAVGRLEWGCAVSGAECAKKDVLTALSKPLQWGRSLSGRDGLTRSADLFAISERFSERFPVMSLSSTSSAQASENPY